MKSRYLLLWLFFIAMACKSKKEPPKQNAGQQPPVVVDVIIAGSSNISNTIEVNGTVVANESVDLRPEISGRLTYLNLPEGGHIQQGTLLARINDADLQATLAKTKVQLDLAQKTEERFRKLLAVNGINQSDYDAALNQVNSLKADLNVTQAQIDKTMVKAPFNGMLGLRMISPGAYVTPTTVLATLQQTDKVKIDFTVPELYAGKIQKGGTVTVQTNAGGHTRTARIMATEPQINATTRNLKVRAMLESGAINPGAFVKVLIEAGAERSILVPTNAIIPDAKAKKLVVVKKGKGAFVDIETGLRMSGVAEVTSGIKAGDSVVVTGVLFVRPNTPVKVKSVKKLSDLQ